jgi:hypothetical protein
MPALLACQPPNCGERGRGGNLMIDLDRVVASREPLCGALQGAGEQVAVAGIDAVIDHKRRQSVGDRGEGGDGEAALAFVPLVVAALGILLPGEVREAGAEGPHQRLPARPSCSRKPSKAGSERRPSMAPASWKRTSAKSDVLSRQ